MSLLTRLLQGPNGKTQSFLEGIFNPVVQYDEMTDSILGLLSNDDTNAMRRTCATLNDGLMARKSNGTFRHRQEAMRDKCDVEGLNASHPSYPEDPCQNGIMSAVRIRRCTRKKREPGFCVKRSRCHRRIKGFLVCTRCRQRALIRPDCQASYFERDSHWLPCSVCTEREERKHPGGARFCECIAKVSRRVLCFECLRARFEYFKRETIKLYGKRTMIWRDVDGQIKFGNEPSHLPVCLGCGTRSIDYSSDLNHATRICLFCRNYNIVPSRHPPIPPTIPSVQLPRPRPRPLPLPIPPATSTVQLPLPLPPAISTVQLPQPRRRSARLNPTETPPTPHMRLSYYGRIRTPNTESQSPQGFSIP